MAIKHSQILYRLLLDSGKRVKKDKDSQLYRENLSQVSFFLVSKAIIDVPINVALQYNHKLFRTSEVKQELAIVQGSSMLPI
jgi:hypothetical protein